MSKQYFFQAGTFPDLSYAELVAMFNTYHLNTDSIHKYSEEILLIKGKDIPENILIKIFNRMGGFVRFGQIIDNLDTF